MSLMLRRSGWMVVSLLPMLAAAQAGKLVIPDFGDLAKKATGSVDITLDGDMLKSATHLMGAAGGRNSTDTETCQKSSSVDHAELMLGNRAKNARESDEHETLRNNRNGVLTLPG